MWYQKLFYSVDRALQGALATNLAPLTYKRYVDNSHARFETVHQSHIFLNILNKQNKAIQYTMEKEDESRLDVSIINTGAAKFEFKIHRKNAITNVQIKPHSYVNPALIRGIFNRVCIQSKEVVFWKIYWWRIKFSCRYVCSEWAQLK